jgi:hypothetical protein
MGICPYHYCVYKKYNSALLFMEYLAISFNMERLHLRPGETFSHLAVRDYIYWA